MIWNDLSAAESDSFPSASMFSTFETMDGQADKEENDEIDDCANDSDADPEGVVGGDVLQTVDERHQFISDDHLYDLTKRDRKSVV